VDQLSLHTLTTPMTIPSLNLIPPLLFFRSVRLTQFQFQYFSLIRGVLRTLCRGLLCHYLVPASQVTSSGQPRKIDLDSLSLCFLVCIWGSFAASLFRFPSAASLLWPRARSILLLHVPCLPAVNTIFAQHLSHEKFGF
jgi:hypothetical protein